MPAPDVGVRGAEQFEQLARRMRAAGRGDLLKELQKALKLAVKPVTPKTRARARQVLPTRGGLAARVARAPQRVTARAGNTTTSVRVTVAGKRSGAAAADAGRVRHPVFDRKNAQGKRVFVEQNVTPGWFSGVVEAERGQVGEDVTQVLEEYTERLAREIGG